MAVVGKCDRVLVRPNDVNVLLGLMPVATRCSNTRTDETHFRSKKTKVASKNMSDQSQNQWKHEDFNVWILGSSIGPLASAGFLIREAEIPAPQIHLFESRGAPEEGLPTTGDAVSGYDHRSSCVPIVRDKSTEYLLTLIPSFACSQQTELDYLNSSKGDVAATRLLFQGDNHLEAIDPNNFSIG